MSNLTNDLGEALLQLEHVFRKHNMQPPTVIGVTNETADALVRNLDVGYMNYDNKYPVCIKFYDILIRREP